MSDEQKHDIDELLSCYIDGELSKRQITEIKRLIEHDEDAAKRLVQLRKQKELLNAMPVEAAPEGLLDDVMASLERKFILNEYTAVGAEQSGERNLLIRRVLAAAVILVLFGGLAALVLDIMLPAAATENNYAAANNTPIADNDLSLQKLNTDYIPSPNAPVFNASLNLKTLDAITMNNFVKKLIFNHDLSHTPPEIEGTSSTVRITCGIDRAVAMLLDLQAEWDRCDEVALTIHDQALSKDIVIENASPEQVLRVFGEDKYYSRMQLAKDFSDFNIMASGNDAVAKSDGDGVSTLAVKPKPELTSFEKNLGNDKAENIEKISLVITVTGL